jgi:hypothetical protein
MRRVKVVSFLKSPVRAGSFGLSAVVANSTPSKVPK